MRHRTAHLLHRTCLFACLGCLILFAYYSLAQLVELPGSSSLRARWHKEVSHRGIKGNRSHRPGLAGPIEASRILMVAAALGIGSVTLRRQALLAAKTSVQDNPEK